jgi:hypothetical protein
MTQKPRTQQTRKRGRPRKQQPPDWRERVVPLREHARRLERQAKSVRRAADELARIR